MIETRERRAVGLITNPYVVNHTYLVAPTPVIDLVADDLGVSIAAADLAIDIRGGVVTLLQLPFDYLSDARSQTLILVISLEFGTAGIVATTLAPSYPWLLTSRTLLGVSIADHHPAHYPLLATAFSETDRGRAYPLHVLGESFGFAISYAIVIDVNALGFGWHWVVAGTVAFDTTFVFVVLSAARGSPKRVRKPATEDCPSSRPTFAGIWRGASELLSSSGLMRLALLSFLTSAATWYIRAYSPQLLTAGYGLTPGTTNPLVPAMLVVGAGTIPVGGAFTNQVGPGTAAFGGYTALAGLAALLAIGSIPPALVASILPFSGTIGTSRPVRSALANYLSERADLGKNFVVVTVDISSGGAVAPPALGVLTDLAGVHVAFGVTAILGLLSFRLIRWPLGQVDGSARWSQATPSD